MNTVTLGWARGVVEVKTFVRQWDAMVFTLALPVVLLALLGAMMGDGETGSRYLVPSMIASGLASATFVNLGLGVASDRSDGTLKRLRGMPVPPAAYFAGKLIVLLAVSLAEVALLLTVGALLFDLPLPDDPARWFTFAWVLLLGVAAGGTLGIAASGLSRSGRGAAAVLNLPYLVLSFISGIYVSPITEVPSMLSSVGSVFPLKWMAQGFRSAFLPDTMASYELAGTWEHGRTAVVLAAWGIGGLVLCLTTFRWANRRDAR